MRRKLVTVLGLAGVLGGSAGAQFGSPPAPFGGGQPVGTPSVRPAAPMTPGGYVPPVGGFQPDRGPMGSSVRPAAGFQPAGPAPAAPAAIDLNDIPTALGLNHPLAVKPEDGLYFISAKSYSRPHEPEAFDNPQLTARVLAEGLAAEIQQTHQCRVFLYELISDEKR